MRANGDTAGPPLLLLLLQDDRRSEIKKVSVITRVYRVFHQVLELGLVEFSIRPIQLRQ